MPTHHDEADPQEVSFARALPELCLSILKIEVIMMALIDRASRALSIGGLFVF